MIRKTLFFVVCGVALFAKGPPVSDAVKFGSKTLNLEAPWLTGPLLTPSAHTIPKGHFNFEPYIFSNNNIAHINNHWHTHKTTDMNHNILMQFETQFGLTPWMDCTFIPEFFYIWNDTSDSWNFGDLLLGVSFQLVRENLKTGVPAIRFAINETFPTGNFQHLSVNKGETDSSGGGTFATSFNLIMSRLWHCYSLHYIAARMAIEAVVFTPTTVHGRNTYGGDSTTNGKVSPGTVQQTLIGLEYNLTRHIALAVDFLSTFTAKTHFHGTTVAAVGRNKYSYSFSMSPAIEFNYTKNVGLIAGIWFTAYTKNTYNFINGVLALNVYI